MGPVYDRWSDTDEGNVQAPVKKPPLEDDPIPAPLFSGTDVEATQDQATQEVTLAQENVQTFERIVELFGFPKFICSIYRKKNCKYGEVWRASRCIYKASFGWTGYRLYLDTEILSTPSTNLVSW